VQDQRGAGEASGRIELGSKGSAVLAPFEKTVVFIPEWKSKETERGSVAGGGASAATRLPVASSEVVACPEPAESGGDETASVLARACSAFCKARSRSSSARGAVTAGLGSPGARASSPARIAGTALAAAVVTAGPATRFRLGAVTVLEAALRLGKRPVIHFPFTRFRV
jgi:hypothetical protein